MMLVVLPRALTLAVDETEHAWHGFVRYTYLVGPKTIEAINSINDAVRPVTATAGVE